MSASSITEERIRGRLMNVTKDLMLQINLYDLGLQQDEARQVTTTLDAPRDVRATISYDGWLTFKYDPASLKGTRRDQLIERHRKAIIKVILHKVDMRDKPSPASKKSQVPVTTSL